MKIKNFGEYVNMKSKDPSVFSKKVAIATLERLDHSLFSIVDTSDKILEVGLDSPIIVDSSFTLDLESINEDSSHLYNRIPVPKVEDIVDKLSSSPYIPKSKSSIKDIRKKFRFPVIASNSKESKEYKTIGKLRASNTIYTKFIENPTPKTKFTLLSFKGEPISIIEKINRFPIDVDLNRFEYLNEAKEICSSIYESFNLELCNISIVESTKGDVLVRSIDTKIDLNPLQEKVVYEHVYEDYYQAKLPNWFKNTVFKDHISEYCKQKELDLKLIKSNNSINYSKLLK